MEYLEGNEKITLRWSEVVRMEDGCNWLGIVISGAL
jgi:hypothetical protein